MAEQTQLHSSWHRNIRGLKQSPQEFYKLAKAAVVERQLPDVTFTLVDHKEGGFFSGSRTYMRIQRGDLYFDVCAAPFADGTFFSWRLLSQGKFLDSALFKDGSVMKGLFKPDTFYKLDTTLMYESIVHEALMGAVDALIQENSLPPIPEADRRPVLAEFYH
jgi:hypothetical protein